MHHKEVMLFDRWDRVIAYIGELPIELLACLCDKTLSHPPQSKSKLEHSRRSENYYVR